MSNWRKGENSRLLVLQFQHQYQLWIYKVHSRKASIVLYALVHSEKFLIVPETIKQCVGSRTVSRNKFQAVGQATEKVQRPNIKCQWRGTNSWWQPADHRCCWQVMSESGMQYSSRYSGGLDSIHRWPAVQRLNCTCWEHPASAAHRAEDRTGRGHARECHWECEQWHSVFLTLKPVSVGISMNRKTDQHEEHAKIGRRRWLQRQHACYIVSQLCMINNRNSATVYRAKCGIRKPENFQHPTSSDVLRRSPFLWAEMDLHQIYTLAVLCGNPYTKNCLGILL